MISENLQRKKAINYIRALLMLIIFLLSVYNYGLIIESKQYVFFYLFVVLVSNAVLWFVDEKYFEGTKLQFWIFLMDIILIVCAAYMLTNMNFYFTLFIFLAIFISSLSQSVALSLLVAVVVNSIYVYILGNTPEGFAISDVSLVLNVPFIFLVALHSSYFAEKSNEDEKERKKLERANVQMEVKIKNTDVEIGTLMNFTARVYDAFREGVIIMDKNGYVKVFNTAAENVFNIRRSAVTQMHIRDLETLGAVKDVVITLLMKKEMTVDKEVTVEAGGVKKLVVTVGYIKDKLGESLGLLCTFKRIMGGVEKPQENK